MVRLFRKNKKKLFKHQLLITAISVFGVVLAMVGSSFAFFASTSKADEYNVLKAGDFELSYVDTGDGYGDVLSLNGSYPISDAEGKNTNPYRFNITNTGTIAADFKIKLLYDEAIVQEDGCQDKLLLQQYVKYQFDNNEPVLLSSKELSDYTIYQVYNMAPGNSEIHEIRIWIDESAPNSVLAKHFHGKLVVEGIQSDDSIYEFNYTGYEQEFIVPATGTYKLETWGAQGGSYDNTYHGGYGGYSMGNILLSSGTKLFITVGGQGNNGSLGQIFGGYNGGGDASTKIAYNTYYYMSSGGGATHISITSGELSLLNESELLMVSGGGGGASYDNGDERHRAAGGNGGGYIGNSASNDHGTAIGGTQQSAGTNGGFGYGGSGAYSISSGGGGGYFGGGSANHDNSPGAGGSGYIGNANLNDKVMYCYDCEESTETSTKTISTTNVSEDPISGYAKIGNGYVRITYLGK